MLNDEQIGNIPMTPEQRKLMEAALLEYEYWRDNEESHEQNADVYAKPFMDGFRMGAMAASANIVVKVLTGLEIYRKEKPQTKQTNEEDHSDHR